MDRREFLKSLGGCAAAGALGGCGGARGLALEGTALTGTPAEAAARPNVIVVFGDQWRAQATGYAGNAVVKTPNLDRLVGESVNFSQAISGCPVCSPYRASLLTGQRPLTHGVFVNDVCLDPEAKSLGRTFAGAGYDTAYIGKWHVDGHGRSNPIPRERRQGFDYWKVLECTHDYNRSAYYEGDDATKRFWEGYDAIAQTRDAQEYVRGRRDEEKPFLLVLSYGPPHAPYHTAPEEFRAIYSPADITLRPNVPERMHGQAREWLAGYYAHCTALDTCVGDLLGTIREAGIEKDTVFLFTSDHGDMLGSHGHQKKQRPWEESIRVPFLLRYPGMAGWRPRETDAPIDAQDIMPTLLGLAGVRAPAGMEGLDFSGHVAGGDDPSGGEALITCPHPFGQFVKGRGGGREYRGLRTRRHTYVRSLEGPWLLYDNEADPHQMRNLVGEAEHAALREELDRRLQAKLDAAGDEFLPGMEYIRRWGYKVNANGTVPYAG
ncbi:MAG: sulfatase family protein [Planctomycetota bacterium]|jgi:arylsulfatase A-like enzyme